MLFAIFNRIKKRIYENIFAYIHILHTSFDFLLTVYIQFKRHIANLMLFDDVLINGVAYCHF